MNKVIPLKKEKVEFTEQDVLQLHSLLSKVKTLAKKDKEFYFDKSFESFLMVMSFLSPQSYGHRIQNRIAKELNWTTLVPSDNDGDIRCPIENKSYEVKASLITETNNSLNLVQIRLWQNVNYMCFWFDISTKEYSLYLLTHDQMMEECELLGTSAHGTKNANENNQNKEIRFSLKVKKEDVDFQRWESKYKSNLLDFMFEKNELTTIGEVANG